MREWLLPFHIGKAIFETRIRISGLRSSARLPCPASTRGCRSHPGFHHRTV